MIEEEAIVVAVEGDYALLQTQRQSACQSCSVNKGCGTSVLSKVVGQRSSQIKVKNTLNVSIGDHVVLGIKENALVQGSLLVYALPLVFMLVFAVVAEICLRTVGMQNEFIVILSAVFGFVISIFVIRFGLYRTSLRQQIQPKMLRIVQQDSVVKHDTMLAP